MKYRRWYQITIQLAEPYQELLSGQLALIGFNGFLQNEKQIHCFIPHHIWNVSTQNKLKSILKRFKHEVPSLKLRYNTKSLVEQNWNRLWEKRTRIIEVPPQIVIKPSWKILPRRFHNKIILHIDPKMAFGTGHHETTRLTLRLIEHCIRPGMTVLDFGCGTGILGIACAKLGAKSVLAVDHDQWAIENAKENVKRNNVQNQMIVRYGSFSAIPHRKYNLVIANIDFFTISRFIKTFAFIMTKRGIIIFSGILTSDISNLSPILKKHLFVPIKHVNENEWSAIALQRAYDAPRFD